MSQQFNQPSRHSRRQRGLSPINPNTYENPMSPDHNSTASSQQQVPSIVNTINPSNSIRTRTNSSNPNNLNSQFQNYLHQNNSNALNNSITVSDASLSQYNSQFYPNIHQNPYRNHHASSDSTISTIDENHNQFTHQFPIPFHNMQSSPIHSHHTIYSTSSSHSTRIINDLQKTINSLNNTIKDLQSQLEQSNKNNYFLQQQLILLTTSLLPNTSSLIPPTTISNQYAPPTQPSLTHHDLPIPQTNITNIQHHPTPSHTVQQYTTSSIHWKEQHHMLNIQPGNCE